MGAGAGAGLQGTLDSATDNDVKQAIWGMNSDTRKKVLNAVMADAKACSEYPPDGYSEEAAAFPDWMKLGCGNAEYYFAEKGCVFPGGKCPDQLPDLSTFTNLCGEAFRDNPGLYDKYKNVVTKGGVTLAKCIKTGMDNPSHPHVKTCGLVAGDEESFTAFKDLFDIVIANRNGGFAPDAKHPTDMDVSKISDTKIDPTGKYVLTSRCRAGRSLRGLPLPPACDFLQRREIEQKIAKALEQFDGEMKGKYYGLCGSKSMGPGGDMDKTLETELRKSGKLFQAPDAPLVLAGGMGRSWPDARGVFTNDAGNFIVWVNEEDHMRVVSMEEGDDMKKIFSRWANGVNLMEKLLKDNGTELMHNDHLGYIHTCPSNLGTGLRAGTMMKIPLFSARADFKDLMKQMGLQARGAGGVEEAAVGGLFDISNSDRLGKSEVTLLNIFIEGSAQIIKWEQACENKEDIEQSIKDYCEKAKADGWASITG